MSALRLMFVAAVSLVATHLPLQAQNAATEVAAKEPSMPVDYYDGLRAWENGAQEVAISLWLRAAEYGDTRAIRKIALEYERGNILPKEPYLATYYAALAERLEGKSFEKTIDSVDPRAGAEIRAAVVEFVPKSSPAMLGSVVKPDPVDALVQAIYGGTEADVLRAVQAMPAVKPELEKTAWQPLFHAAAAGRADAVKAILEPMTWISDFRVLTAEGLSVMHFAAMSGSEPTVRALYEGGAVAFAETPNGLLPSAAADKAGFSELADILRGFEKDEVRLTQEKLNLLGYDVGSPDGVFGPRTRMQMAIAANGLGLSSNRRTPEIAYAIAFMFSVDVWGGIYAYRKKSDGKDYVSFLTSVSAVNRQLADDSILSRCKSNVDRVNCKVQAVLPLGACIAAADSEVGDTKGALNWSRAFPSELAAKEDALAMCAAKSDGECEIWQSFCVVSR